MMSISQFIRMAIEAGLNPGGGGGGGGTNVTNQKLVCATGNDTTGNGSESTPFKTVMGAILKLGPTSAANPYTLKLSGIVTEEQDVVWAPYYSIVGDVPFGTQWNIPTPFTFTLDPAWDTGFAFGAISSVMASCDIGGNLDLSSFTGGGTKLFFLDKAFLFQNLTITGDANTIVAVLPGTSVQGSLSLTLNDISTVFMVSPIFGGNLTVNTTFTLEDLEENVGWDTNVFVQGAECLPGSGISVNSVGGSAARVEIRSSTIQPNSISGDGATTRIFNDVASFTPATLTNGATQEILNPAATSIIITGTSQNISANGKYQTSNAALTNFFLPSTFKKGDSFEIIGAGSGGWKINQTLPGQYLKLLNASTTIGASGFLASTVQNQNVIIECIEDDLGFLVKYATDFGSSYDGLN